MNQLQIKMKRRKLVLGKSALETIGKLAMIAVKLTFGIVYHIQLQFPLLIGGKQLLLGKKYQIISLYVQ